MLATYGLAIFVALPAALGVLAGSLYEAGGERAGAATVGVALLSLLLVCAGILLLALDGLACVIMAAPLAFPLAAAGAVAAHWGRGHAREPRAFGAVALAVPLLLAGEAGLDRPPVPRAVTTEIVVDAPPAAVWRRVVAFPPLPEPDDPVFAAIAYPVSATIEGRGVGAVRRCRFSTGDFVEPVTVWEPGRRLAFTVAEQPEPMHELSPWGEIHPPHLDGFLSSRRGEFRLEPLPGGRTRLVGTTWYESSMWPSAYWRRWSDGLIHRIHLRVLRHVAAHAERDHHARP